MSRLFSFLLFMFLAVFLGLGAKGQSLEVMPGTERIFMDAQWIKRFDEQGRWSLFSRSRATVDYEDETNLFTGAFLSYTTPTRFGASLIGSISSSGGATNGGIHYALQKENLTLFAIVNTQFFTNPNIGWFSIMRYRPSLSDQWKLYSSLELFTRFESGDGVSVQRIRGGLDKAGFQFGLAINLREDRDFEIEDFNPGVFIRKEF